MNKTEPTTMQKTSGSLVCFLLAFALLTLIPVLPGTVFGRTEGVPQQDQPVPNIAQGPLPAQAETIEVLVRKSVVLNSGEVLKRVSVADPSLATAVIISPQQVLINGLAPGETTLVLWNEAEEPRTFDLRVQFDLRALRQAIDSSFPDAEISIGQSRNAIVLTGTVASQPTADQVAALAKTEAENVVNLLAVQKRGMESVLLQVRFAEVNRAAIQELGFSFFSTGFGNTMGSITTQQFQQFGANVGALPPGVEGGQAPQLPSLATGGIGNKLSGSPAIFGLSDLANIFLFRPDANLGVTIRALEQRNLLEILAEPNVLALNGREASFLAGGEFPFPVVQGGGNFTAVTIVFKEFGVRLRFKPDVQDDGTILLHVAPEVSSLDFSNALTISGFVVPALSTRRAETEISLRDGQSFAIAGLIDNRLTEIASKVPGLGDIPFLGKLFQSRSKNRVNTELLVLVTPKLVQPIPPGQMPPLPQFPKPLGTDEKFEKQFEGNSGEAREKRDRQ
ncbi:MAG: type II and III secretion system protein family protein [Acidobacteria bacterium]|nr:MAG: type II and III secretion system protein family protein [Acidobacteriota bacterium]